MIASDWIGHATAEWQPGSLRLAASGKRRAAKVEARVLPSYPTGRFSDWDSLDSVAQAQATDIMEYDKNKWNIPGQNNFESLSFEAINFTSLEMGEVAVQKNKEAPLTPIQVIMHTMNITEASWDCYLNHYVDYFWEELVEYEVVEYFEALGWTEESWLENEEPPPSDEKNWFELSEGEKAAAESLCYFAELWSADIEISLWASQPEETADDENTGDHTGNGNATNTTGSDVERPYISPWDLPVVRFVLWDNLTETQTNNTIVFGYNETTWNSPGTAEIELNYTSFEDLTPEQNEAAKELGIDKFYWDCLFQHYNHYSWNDLASLGVKPFWETLGWTFESWHGIASPPTTATLPYEKLSSPEQQKAADQLCYLPETYGEGGNLAEIDLASLAAPPANASSTAPSAAAP